MDQQRQLPVAQPPKAVPAPEPLAAHPTSVAHELLFGSVAGMVGKLFEYPFDTIKVRLQAQPSAGASGSVGAVSCFKHALQTKGFMSLYRGLSAPMFGAAVENSSLFFSYELAQAVVRTQLGHIPELKDAHTGDLSLAAKVFCGGVSGAVTSLALTPIELVKCKMQMPGSTGAAPGVVSIMRTIFRTSGLGGFWHGQMGTLLRESGGSAAWFGAHAGLTQRFKKRKLLQEADDLGPAHLLRTRSSDVVIPVHQQLFAGAVAGMSYNFLFYPADTIKSCMQTHDVREAGPGSAAPSVQPAAKQPSFYDTGKQIWRADGVRGFYRGCGITVFRSAPSSAFIFYIHDTLVRIVGNWNGGGRLRD